MCKIKAWWNTRKITNPQNLDKQQIEELFKAIEAERKIKSVLRKIWALLLGCCTIIAAIFSVLTFFNQ